MRHSLRYASLVVVLVAVRPAAAVNIDGTWAVCFSGATGQFCGPSVAHMTATGNVFTISSNLCTITGSVDAMTGQITVPAGQCPLAGLTSFTGTATDTTFDAIANFLLCSPFTVDGVRACPACDDGNECSTDGCGSTACSQPGSSCTGVFVPDGDPCDDANACTTPDLCIGGGCQGASVLCDDGNPCTDDSCDGSTGDCVFSPNTAPCDDGSLCTSGDTCSAGACTGGPAVTCDACETCFPFLGCRVAERTNCRQSLGKGKILLKDAPDDARDKISWSWGKGDATTSGDLGSPTTTDGYTLCVFDGPLGNRRLLLDAAAPAGGTCANGTSCWQAKGAPPGSKGYVYKDTQLLIPDGVKRITLKPGVAGKAKAKVSGLGSNLDLPSPMNINLPVIVQLQGENGICFGTAFHSAKTDTEDTFKAVNSPSGAFVDGAR